MVLRFDLSQASAGLRRLTARSPAGTALSLAGRAANGEGSGGMAAGHRPFASGPRGLVPASALERGRRLRSERTSARSGQTPRESREGWVWPPGTSRSVAVERESPGSASSRARRFHHGRCLRGASSAGEQRSLGEPLFETVPAYRLRRVTIGASRGLQTDRAVSMTPPSSSLTAWRQGHQPLAEPPSSRSTGLTPRSPRARPVASAVDRRECLS